MVEEVSPVLDKWLMSHLPAAAQLIADDRVNDIKESLGIECPTTYSTGEGVRHSPEGGPPYRESGRLQEGIKGRVENHLPEEIDIIITSTRTPRSMVPSVLEFGLAPMHGPRPYMGPGRNRALLRVPEILQHVCGGGV